MNLITVKLHIRRNTQWENFSVEIGSNAYVLDALEAASAQDSTLLYRHSCHHGSCGSCGLRINGREHLACITKVKDVINSNGIIRLEPLRNFTIIRDLLVDFRPFMLRLDEINLPLRRSAEQLSESIEESDKCIFPSIIGKEGMELLPGFNRLENCIECGLCNSACPITGSDKQYKGPAYLAAAARVTSEPRQRDLNQVLMHVNDDHGIWRCHAAFECSEVCPGRVDPAREILVLRAKIIRRKTKNKNQKRKK